MRNIVLYSATALSLSLGATAARTCGNSTATPSTYEWRVSDARYDGADPGESNGTSTLAISIQPATSATFYECVAQWPESWAGFYEDGNIIWSDCIWAGNGQTSDIAIAFAMDWVNRTMFVSHTFGCSNREGSDALATGSVHLDMNCTTATEDSNHCTLASNGTRPSVSLSTQEAPARLDAGATCTENSERYQSWQLEGWQRQYEIVPGSATITSDTGPSFTLRNMANSDVFTCAPSGNQTDTFEGTCAPETEGDSITTAGFRFDPAMDMLTISQQWSCDSSSFDAIGVGFVQATCDRAGTMLTCTSGPLWIGTKTV